MQGGDIMMLEDHLEMGLPRQLLPEIFKIKTRSKKKPVTDLKVFKLSFRGR